MSEQELTIRIDTRYNRFCIHRKTLRAIGDPAFVCLGYRAQTKELMLLGTWTDERGSIRVRYDGSGSFYINSKGLIEGIRCVSNILLKDGGNESMSICLFGDVDAINYNKGKVTENFTGEEFQKFMNTIEFKEKQ